VKTTLLLFFAAAVMHDRADAIEYSNAVVAGKRVLVCCVNVRKERLQLFLRDDMGRPLKSFEGVDRWLKPRGQRLIFAMNAGMYQPDLSPLGIYISDGKQLTPLNTTNGIGNFFLKPNGVFLLSDAGARVVETSEYSQLPGPVSLATQSGPLLVRAGKIHPAFNLKSVSRTIRNGVGVPSPDIAIFAISDEPVNFFEFATLFRDVLGCPDALYLDGLISSLHSTQLKRSDSKANLGPIIGISQ
jgi:uncharacterized protein YigE (DUF2233 family)